MEGLALSLSQTTRLGMAGGGSVALPTSKPILKKWREDIIRAQLKTHLARLCGWHGPEQVWLDPEVT